MQSWLSLYFASCPSVTSEILPYQNIQNIYCVALNDAIRKGNFPATTAGEILLKIRLDTGVTYINLNGKQL